MIIVGFMMAKLKKKCIRRIVFLRKMHEQMEIRRKCNNFLWKKREFRGDRKKRTGHCNAKFVFFVGIERDY